MIDIHSHILPGIDDGSKHLEMTRDMLEESKRQGVTIQVATPHFYADRMKMDTFLKQREEALQMTLPIADELGITLLKGAEVAMFRGIGKADVESLVIQKAEAAAAEAFQNKETDGSTERTEAAGKTLKNKKLLLLEMPFRPWEERDLQEVERLLDRGFTPILAHIERFYSFQKSRETKEIMEEIFDLDVYKQVNAGEFLSFFSRGKVLKLLKESAEGPFRGAQLLGSDMHNTSSRPQCLRAARDVIEKKLGEEALDRIDSLGEALLKDC